MRWIFQPIHRQLSFLTSRRMLLGISVLAILIILLRASAHRRREFPSDIQIAIRPLENGAFLLSENDVLRRLTLAFGNTLKSTEIQELDLMRIEAVVEEEPFVKKAEVYLSQNNTLHIEVVQREPILRVLDNYGGNYYLDETGAMMPFSPLHTPRVLVATGNLSPYTSDFRQKKRNTLKEAFELALRLREDPIWSTFIQQIHLNNANEFILIPLIGDQKIVLGNLKNVEDKLRRLKIFYEQSMPYVGWRTYQTISLKYAGQVLCRR